MVRHVTEMNDDNSGAPSLKAADVIYDALKAEGLVAPSDGLEKAK
jgi:hypothetical protein